MWKIDMAFFEEIDEEQQNNSLWVERYRPNTLENYIGNEHLKNKVEYFIEAKDVPHLLLHGRAGGGKCLDFSEEIDIEIELTEDEVSQLSKFIIMMIHPIFKSNIFTKIFWSIYFNFIYNILLCSNFST